MNTVQRIAKNTGVQVASRAAETLVGVFFVAFVARVFGPETYGKYCFAMVLPSMFAAFVMYGLDVLATREIARNRSITEYYIGGVLALQIAIAPVVFGMIAIVVNIGHYPSDIKLAVYIFGIAMLVNTIRTFLDSVFRAFERMEFTASLNIFNRIFTAAAGVTILILGYRLIGLALVFLIGNILTLGLSCLLLNKGFARVILKLDIAFWKGLIRESWPFALTSIFSVYYLNVGLLILSKMDGDVATGLYGSAFKLCNYLVFGGIAFGNALFPVLAWSFQTSPVMFTQLYKSCLKIVTLCIVPFALVTTFLAKDIVRLFFGPDFALAVSSLRIMVWIVPFSFLIYPLGNILLCMNKQLHNLLAIFVAFITSVLLNIALIPELSYLGATIALLGGTIALAGLQYYFIAIELGRVRLLPIISKTILGCSGIVAAMYAVRGFNMFKAGAVGLITYFIIIFCLRPLKKNETDLLKQLLQRKTKSLETAS
jgi:O-antigen/teichoic acid export membrane protein